MNASREQDYRLRPLQGDARSPIALVEGRQIRIGRSADCEVRVEDQSVSRKHALLLSNPPGAWYVYDLRSRNGTFVNGAAVVAGTKLLPGDEVRLGPDGPAFSFERRSAIDTAESASTASAYRPRLGGRSAPVSTQTEGFHISSILPIFPPARLRRIKGENLGHGLALIAAAVTAAIFVPTYHENGYALSLAVYLLYLTCSEVCRMAGCGKPWFVVLSAAVVSAAITTAVLAVKPELIFGHAWSVLFVQEATKALTVMMAVVLAAPMFSRFNRFAVMNALDGIVIGAASAAGFEFLQAFREMVDQGGNVSHAFCMQGGGVAAMLPEVVADIAGNVAYTGFFGYLIGLALTTRQRGRRIRYLLAGAFMAVGLHWLSTAACGTVINRVNIGIAASVAVAVTSFLLFLAAIARARRIAGVSVPLSSHSVRRPAS